MHAWISHSDSVYVTAVSYCHSVIVSAYIIARFSANFVRAFARGSLPGSTLRQHPQRFISAFEFLRATTVVLVHCTGTQYSYIRSTMYQRSNACMHPSWSGVGIYVGTTKRIEIAIQKTTVTTH